MHAKSSNGSCPNRNGDRPGLETFYKVNDSWRGVLTFCYDSNENNPSFCLSSFVPPSLPPFSSLLLDQSRSLLQKMFSLLVGGLALIASVVNAIPTISTKGTRSLFQKSSTYLLLIYMTPQDPNSSPAMANSSLLEALHISCQNRTPYWIRTSVRWMLS